MPLINFYTGTVMSGKTKLLLDFIKLFNRNEILVIVPKLVTSNNKSYVIKSRAKQYKNFGVIPDLCVGEGVNLYDCVVQYIKSSEDNIGFSEGDIGFSEGDISNAKSSISEDNIGVSKDAGDKENCSNVCNVNNKNNLNMYSSNESTFPNNNNLNKNNTNESTFPNNNTTNNTTPTNNTTTKKIKAIFVDEIQFLTIPQINNLNNLKKTLKIPIYTFGITCSHRNELFETSRYLLNNNSIVQYLSSRCFICNKLADTNIRFDYRFSACTVEPMDKKELFYPVCSEDWNKLIVRE